jgi:hypothetical protein
MNSFIKFVNTQIFLLGARKAKSLEGRSNNSAMLSKPILVFRINPVDFI